jgi:AcrR family transcriptional regulator
MATSVSVREDRKPRRERRPGHGGRPTAAEGRRRQQRLLDTAIALFMSRGFDGTSIEAVAEAVGMSKRTVYARYRDKNELFGAALRALIDRSLAPFNQFQTGPRPLEPTLMAIGRHLLSVALTPQSVGLYRILVAEAERHPELARLAHAEGRQQAIRGIEAALRRHARELRARDLGAAAEQFLSLVVDSSLRGAALGLRSGTADIDRTVGAAVDLFLNGAANGRRG